MGVSICAGLGIDPDTLPDPPAPTPVALEHRAKVAAALADAHDYLGLIMKLFDSHPDGDGGLDAMMPDFGAKLRTADFALGHYRAVRECHGSS